MRNTYPKPKPLCPLFAITRKVLPDGNFPSNAKRNAARGGFKVLKVPR